MASINFRIVNCFVLFVVFTLVIARPHDWESKLNQELEKNVRGFLCGVPQRRSFSLRELFKEKIHGNEKLLPPMTVLHRCDSYAGCCAAHEECAPATSEKVQLVFRSVPLTGGSGMHSYKVLEAYNHTSCSCQPIQDLPK